MIFNGRIFFVVRLVLLILNKYVLVGTICYRRRLVLNVLMRRVVLLVIHSVGDDVNLILILLLTLLVVLVLRFRFDLYFLILLIRFGVLLVLFALRLRLLVLVNYVFCFRLWVRERLRRPRH